MHLNINKSLALRIVLYVLTPCVILFLISLSVFYFFSKTTLEKMTFENAQATTQNTVFKTEQVLIATRKITENYKWIFEKEDLSCQEVIDFTQLIVENNPEILGCAIAFEPGYYPEKGQYFAPYSYRDNGIIISSMLGSDEYDYPYMDWYQIPTTIEKPYWSEPYYDSGGAGSLIATYSVPFYKTMQGQSTLAGVITVDLSLDWLTDIVSSVHILQTGYAALISRNGTYVTHAKKELIMNQTIFSYAAELESPELREIGRDMLAGHTGFVSIRVKNADWFVSYTPLPTSNWTIEVVFPKAEMYAPLQHISRVLLVLIVVGLCLLTFIIVKIITHQIAPLRLFSASAREVAGGNFDAQLPDIASEDEMKDLHDSFVHMQDDLKSYVEHLKETTSAKEKIESELRIAREIQMGMIPKIFPPFPNLTELDLFASLEPAKEVGGDLYDFFLIDDSHLCIAIGDVSGKGVPASLFMAVTRTLLRSIAPKQRSPREIINTLNTSLSQGNESSMFVTFFLGIINIDTGEMRYTNAGHNPPVLVRPHAAPEMFAITKNIPLGLFEDYDYQEHTCTLAKRDCLFLYTDGVTEAENVQKQLYSDETMMSCLATLDANPKALIQGIKHHVSEHVLDNEQSDDLTMLSIVYYGK